MQLQIPVESDESDTDQKNGHNSDEEGTQDSADEALSDKDPPPPPTENSGEGSGANGKSIRKEKVEDSDSELNHSDEDVFEAEDSQGAMDQSDCSASELVNSMEQDDLDGSNQPDSS